MSNLEHWRAIDVQDTRIPNLLVKTTFDENGYDICMTDLGRLWRETLSRDEIIRRASESACSVDPGSGTDQARILYHKIEAALSQQDDTSLLFKTGRPENHGFDIIVQASLPAGLLPLVWTIEMTLQSGTGLGEELVLPLLVRNENLQDDVDLLITRLHEKDRVITRITDRLETLGHDLTRFFPGVSEMKTSKKKAQKEQLGGHIKGLSLFDEPSWRTRERTPPESWTWKSRSMNEILKNLPCTKYNPPNDTRPSPWWNQLEEPKDQRNDQNTNYDLKNYSPVLPDTTVIEDGPCKPTSLYRGDSRTDTEDDDTTSEVSDIDSTLPLGPPSTVDEKQHDHQDMSSMNVESHTNLSKEGTRISEAKKAGPKLGAFGGKPRRDTASEHQNEYKPMGGKLGAFGGKRKEFLIDTELPRAEETSHQAITPSEHDLPSRNSLHGEGKSKETAEHSHPRDVCLVEENDSRMSPVGSQQRADVRRHKLKRDLEQFAKGPAKKGRKF